jgi:hypothetical protein
LNQPPIDRERVADDVAQRLLERATALDDDGATLEQLRQAAMEAGISAAAFDAAVAEWRANPPARVAAAKPRHWAERALRNAAGLAVGWSAVAALAVTQGLVGAPWLVHKLTDPIGLAIGALVAARLRARTATILLCGLAVAQGAEFLMDLFSGEPAVRGFGAHTALMIAGVAATALGRAALGRRTDPADHDGDTTNTSRYSPSDDALKSRSVGQTDAEADTQFMEMLRLRRHPYRLHWQVG